ncbi:acyltransferase family protein [Chryseobacterium sp.]|uniref:acyltransferase family protein n=1 Tax=Chryseobacterium sp. TaxID=1871047 RepID=UPI0035B0332B
MTERSERLYGLDHLRAIAILLVLMYHYRAFKHPGWIDSIGKFGWTGVDLFFVLSGYLISGQLFKEIRNKGAISLKTFYIKRFFRLIFLRFSCILHCLFSGNGKLYHLYGSFLLLPKIMGWMLSAAEHFHMHGHYVLKNSFISFFLCFS